MAVTKQILEHVKLHGLLSFLLFFFVHCELERGFLVNKEGIGDPFYFPLSGLI